MRAIMVFSIRHKNAKRYLGSLASHIDTHNKMRTYKEWKKFTQIMREQAFLNNQKDVVETITDRQEEIG